MFNKILNFLKHDVWTVEVAKLSPIQAFGLRILRLILLILKSFTKKEIQEKASVLTYYTVLSIIPILAFMFAISRGLLLEQDFILWLYNNFNIQRPMVEKLIAYAEEALQATKNTTFAFLGSTIFLWSTVKLLSQLEWGLNYLFHAKRGRPFLRKCTDYIAIIIVAPLLLILSSGFTLFLSAKFHGSTESSYVYSLINFFSYLIVGFLFSFLYLFLPNAKVRGGAAIIGGFLAALIFQLLQIAYLKVQFLITGFGNVAATLGGLSLFLIWVQLCWVIFLLGAKLTYSIQYIDAYEFIVDAFPISEYTKEIVSLIITQFCIYEFCKKNLPPSSFEISRKLSIPLQITHFILENLVYTEVLVEVKVPNREENGYHPASDVNQLTIKKVLDMINKKGDAIPLPEKREVETILSSLKEFEKLIENSNANILLKEI